MYLGQLLREQFSYLFLIAFLFSCSSQEFINEGPFLKDNVVYLVIPITDGCNSCVKATFNFVKENRTRIKDSKRLDVIFTSIYDLKSLKLNWDESVLNSFNVDTSNYYITKGYVNIYPALLELNSNEVSTFTFDPEYVAGYLHQIDSIYLKQ